MNERSLTLLYIKRSFTKNLKKQLFLIFGIASFMVMAAITVISDDSNTNSIQEKVKSQRWGYDAKFEELTEEQLEFVLEQPEVVDSYQMDCFEITAGVDNASFLVSADFPESFLTSYVYGTVPKQGEVAFPESARIDGKRPTIGQEVVFEICVGDEKQNVAVKVSGVFREHEMYNTAYIAMYGADFVALLEECGMGKEGAVHVFIDTTNVENARAIWVRMLGVFGTEIQVQSQGVSNENLTNWGYLDVVIRNLQISLIVGSVSMIAIIYMVLKDERKTLGIFRALGAKRRQIVGMLSARMAVLALAGAGIGTVVGAGILWLKRVLMEQQTEAYEPTYISLLVIPVAAIVFFLAFQIPAVLYVLRRPAIDLMRGDEVRGKNLISYKNKRLHKVKRPLWWYAGLETKRVKRNTVILCLVTASSLAYVMASLLQADYRLEAKAVDAVETDYAISRSEGSFTEAEIEEILKLNGVAISEYGVQTFEKNLASWDGMELSAKVRIIEENTFYEFKVNQARTPMLPRFKGTLEEALAGGRILVEPTYQLVRQKEMLAGDTMLIRNSAGEEIPFEIATVGGKKDDGTCDCYIYVDFFTYEKLFGTPDITTFHVTLDGVKLKDVRKSLEKLSKEYSIEENELLMEYTERQLKWDEIVALLEETVISLLISFSFLICYYSFYFLSKKEEYWMLYAQGASKEMLQKIILSQALRMSFWSSFVTVAAATVMAYMTKDQLTADIEGLVETGFLWWMIPVGMALIILVSMSATWLASRGMLRKLELKTE